MTKRDFNDHCWKDIVDQEILDIYAWWELFLVRRGGALEAEVSYYLGKHLSHLDVSGHLLEG